MERQSDGSVPRGAQYDDLSNLAWFWLDRGANDRGVAAGLPRRPGADGARDNLREARAGVAATTPLHSRPGTKPGIDRNRVARGSLGDH